MKVQIKLFAFAKELAGRDEVAVEVGDTPTVADVRRALLRAVPEVEPALSHSRWAVDAEFVTEDAKIDDGSEIALIPPVSGG